MSVAKELKAEQIEQIKKSVKESKAFVLVEYEGINVEQDTKLRSDFRANNVKYQVLKSIYAYKIYLIYKYHIIMCVIIISA